MKCTKTSPRNNFFILSTSKGPSHPITRRERAHRGLPPPAATLAVRPVPSPRLTARMRTSFAQPSGDAALKFGLESLWCFYVVSIKTARVMAEPFSDESLTLVNRALEHPGANSRILTVWEDGQELKGIHWLAFLVFLYVSKLLQLTFKCFKLEDTMRRGKKPSQFEDDIRNT